MAAYDVGFIGTGPDPENPVWGESAAMAYQHAGGYDRLESCDIVACADLVRENAEDFADRFDIPADHIFEDYEEMLASVQPDVVSISTPVPTHAEIVLDCIDSAIPAAIHCEKPMASTWGDSREMARAAAEAGIQLTFNHQRRMAAPWRTAKAVLDDGAIGDLQRIELGGGELFDMATHYIDLANFYNDQHGVDWVLGNVDYRQEHVKYGAHNENQSVSLWAYENGVYGFASTGHGTDAIPSELRLLGTDGVIDVLPTNADVDLRVRSGGDGWRPVEYDEPQNSVYEAIEHIVESLQAGTEPELSASNALDCTEVIFATYEAARERGRIDLPLEIDDNPLESMVESGALTPEAPSDAE